MLSFEGGLWGEGGGCGKERREEGRKEEGAVGEGRTDCLELSLLSWKERDPRGLSSSSIPWGPGPHCPGDKPPTAL